MNDIDDDDDGIVRVMVRLTPTRLTMTVFYITVGVYMLVANNWLGLLCVFNILWLQWRCYMMYDGLYEISEMGSRVLEALRTADRRYNNLLAEYLELKGKHDGNTTE